MTKKINHFLVEIVSPGFLPGISLQEYQRNVSSKDCSGECLSSGFVWYRFSAIFGYGFSFKQLLVEMSVQQNYVRKCLFRKKK